MTEVAPTGLGGTLRTERLRRGLDLATIAAETKIGCHILEAIERDQFDSMPGGAYRRSFLRQYAHALGLDEDETLAAFQREFQEPCLPLPVPPKKARSRLLLEVTWALAAVAACVGIYWLTESVHTIQAIKEAGMARISPVPEPPRLQAPSPASDTGGALTPVRVAPGAPRLQAPSPASDTGGALTPVRVAFTATEPVWVSVRCDGTVCYTGTLLEQQIKTFESCAVVTALIGNAAGLMISLDGRPLGPVGSPGEIQLLELSTNGARRLPHRPATTKAGVSDPPMQQSADRQ